MRLFGFTLLRNGVKYDYPFLESLRSLCALCEEVYVALGDSDDGTEEKLKEFSNLVVVPTVWDETVRKSGSILSQQTNIALEALRKRQPKGWGIYLQADEVLSERDFPRIREDLAAAEREGADALSFRYLHFWQSYHQIAVGKRWYPQEIRAIRLDSAAESYGDAQSFRGGKKRFETDAIVYHYGHVREEKAYAKKKADFHRWWHNDEEMKKVLAEGERSDRYERSIAYLGPQPGFMRERIGESISPSLRPRALVYGRKEDFPGLEARVRAGLRWTSSFAEFASAKEERKILLGNPPLGRWLAKVLGLGSSVPKQMGSPQARPWTRDFRAILQFSEQGIYVE